METSAANPDVESAGLFLCPHPLQAPLDGSIQKQTVAWMQKGDPEVAVGKKA